MDIVRFWNKCNLAEHPFVHPEDRETLDRYGRGVLTLSSLDFAAYLKSPRFCRVGDRHFHLLLLPVPYAGCVAKADIFVLGLNPGFNVTDYYAEYCVPKFRHELEANLRQKSSSAEFPFLYLNPRFCWHSGYWWWEGKFRDIATTLARERSYSYYDSLRELSKRVAAVELVPYHSTSFPYRAEMRQGLRSSECARAFVLKTVIPRAVRGEAVVIVTRAAKDWGLGTKGSRGVVVCPNPQNVTLSTDSPAGKAILFHLRVDQNVR
jgi:hypothetical protein